ncbi:MAG: HU family DNA-binding protein [Acidobacteria bacterium]|nr:HU family DNA-binding protein [Acidobacteriota bacterium]MBI3658605.1 HU family DNA-binding protein [Acidobacteriota bacterium]
MAAKPLTKSQIVTLFADKLEVTKAVAAAFLEELSTVAASEAKKCGTFVIPGIGKIVKAHRKARSGRNPQTGEAIKIPAKTVLKIRVLKALKDAVLPTKK